MQNSSAEVSVVIPARNEEHFIESALASVAAQTWSKDTLEVIVVDNGSTDGTAERVRSYISRNPSLRIQLIAEPVAGVARAKNRGIQSARGTCIIFLDADSCMAPDLVQKVMKRVRHGYEAGTIRVIANSRDPVDRAFFGVLEFGKALFKLHAQMFFCSRALFARFGTFDEQLQLAEDRELLQRLQRARIPLCQVRDSWIATSPRRLHKLPLRLNMMVMFLRWALANWGVGRDWPY